MSDVLCPYCTARASVNYDDGHGYAEDVRHEMTCPSCEKSFVFTTYISFSHTAYRADCLNGSPHELAMTSTYPKRYARMACKNMNWSDFAGHQVKISDAPKPDFQEAWMSGDKGYATLPTERRD